MLDISFVGIKLKGMGDNVSGYDFVVSRIVLIILCLIFLLLPCRSLLAQHRIVIATPGFEHPLAEVARIILPEAYAKIGYAVDFLELPPKRAQLAIEQGIVDAYIFSDANFIVDLPGTIMVPTSLGEDEFVAFVVSDSINITGWESLKPFVVGYFVGMIPVERRLTDEYRTVPSQDASRVFLMLSLGRCDVVIAPRWMGLSIIHDEELNNITITGPVLVREPVYHYLATKNADLAPVLDAVLSDMAKSGRIREVTMTVMQGRSE